MDRLWTPRFAPWWWLALPAALIVLLPIINHAAPAFYQARMLPEGYGVLELSHFFIPLLGFFLGLRLLFNPVARSRSVWWFLILLGTLACFYTAGEEHSWGQHFFNWETPEEWSRINRQHETNLHNVSPLFNMLPRAVLELTIVVCGLLLPLLAWLGHPVHLRGLEPFEPSIILVPVSIGALIYKLDSMFQKELGFGGQQGLVTRPAEAAETFYVLFMLFYLILIQRRLDDMVDAGPVT